MGKPFLIVNPRSANGATGKHFDTISALVRQNVGEHDHAFTERPFHACELARKAIEGGSELVIAVGGDGTINETVNGFFGPLTPGATPKAINPNAALAILPRGTGGDFRRTVGLDGNLQKSAARLKNAPRPLDVGLAEFETEDGKIDARCFVNVAGSGVGAEIVKIVNDSSKVLGGRLTFMVGSLRGLMGWSDVSLRASLDGGPFEELTITSYSVGNGRYFGGGMMVAPEAKLDDGMFHVTIWTGFTLVDFVVKSAGLYDGSHVKFKGTRTASARTLRLEPGSKSNGRKARVELDGELVGRVPVTYTALPGAIRLVG
ncbi:MAG: diacylglycerol kinase family lipid kinase [Deltaproteobacteria bacterium]|nr:diacylglycerol kinase family lipid kinase [Deltaproteobacteria bacterium]